MNRDVQQRKLDQFDNANISQDDLWGTFDLGITSSLISLGFDLIDLKKDNPRKAQFIFKRTDEIEKAVNDYWSDNLRLNPRSLFDNQKMLKNRLYSD